MTDFQTFLLAASECERFEKSCSLLAVVAGGMWILAVHVSFLRQEVNLTQKRIERGKKMNCTIKLT
jgi:hypothetical protein